MLSDEQGSSPPIAGNAKSLANLRPPWKKGQSGNPAGKPKDLARLGDLFAQELFKVVPANIGGKIVKRSQAESGAYGFGDGDGTFAGGQACYPVSRRASINCS
jgi:hypothetical protein